MTQMRTEDKYLSVMAKTKGLGRGLDALLGGEDFSTADKDQWHLTPTTCVDFPKPAVTNNRHARRTWCAFADIEANPNQPRRVPLKKRSI